ncbi:MAG: DEAD/DEAH box helicase family protein, partial [Eubacterium sp.]
MSHFKLRPYQAACIAAIPETGSYLIQMATGLGKTVTFSQVPRRGRMLLLSHREELVRQPAKYFDCSFGVEQAGEKSHGEMVVSASVQSLIRRLGRFAPDTFDI